VYFVTRGKRNFPQPFCFAKESKREEERPLSHGVMVKGQAKVFPLERHLSPSRVIVASDKVHPQERQSSQNGMGLRHQGDKERQFSHEKGRGHKDDKERQFSHGMGMG
jgi:hypothetical protein